MNVEVTVVDSHVHVHAGTDVSALLDAASTNLSAVAARVGAEKAQHVLMLAEIQGSDWFEASCAKRTPLDRWKFESLTEDSASLVAKGPGAELTIIAGRQIVTSEGIEVLALATRARIDDGMTLGNTISTAVRHEALVVLPWGAGKWLGTRGRLVADAVAAGTPKLFVGDNGGRPSFWPEPAVFAIAEANGRPVLPGTDPLPLPREERRVGSFGFWLRGLVGATSPSRSLRDRLLNVAADGVVRFGQLQGPMLFLRNQLLLRIR
jgi:hypothetical protein